MLQASNTASKTAELGKIFMRMALFICFQQQQKNLFSNLQLI